MAKATVRVPDQADKLRAARLSFGSNIVLTIIKMGVGLISGSVSIVAEAAHSATDVVASGLALVSVSKAGRPPDDDHAFGHGKIEDLSALAQGTFLFCVGGFIIYEAVLRLFHHVRPARLGWGIAVMALSAATNIVVVRYMKRIAEKTDSQALRADAQDHFADVLGGVGVLIGLLLVRFTGNPIFDPLLAFGVSILILGGATHLMRTGIAVLIDTQLPAKEVLDVKSIFDADPNVKAYHRLRTRKAGSVRHIDAHVLMDDDLTLLDSHDLTEKLEARIRAKLPNATVHLHTEPYHAEVHHQQEEHGETISCPGEDAVNPDDVRPAESRRRTTDQA